MQWRQWCKWHRQDWRFNTVESTSLESRQSVLPVLWNHSEVMHCSTQYLYLLAVEVESTVSCFQRHLYSTLYNTKRCQSNTKYLLYMYSKYDSDITEWIIEHVLRFCCTVTHVKSLFLTRLNHYNSITGNTSSLHHITHCITHNNTFSISFPIILLSPVHIQILWLLQIFQVGGQPVIYYEFKLSQHSPLTDGLRGKEGKIVQYWAILVHWPDPVKPDPAVLFHQLQAIRPARPGLTAATKPD